MTRSILGSVLVSVTLFLGGCGGGGGSVGKTGTLVGGSCTDKAGCEDQCQSGGDFPGGVCTLACTKNSDCPSGTVCSEQEGGICLLSCSTAADCRDGWDCETVGLKEGGSAKMCDNP